MIRIRVLLYLPSNEPQTAWGRGANPLRFRRRRIDYTKNFVEPLRTKGRASDKALNSNMTLVGDISTPICPTPSHLVLIKCHVPKHGILI
jgi:hypothetical protein